MFGLTADSVAMKYKKIEEKKVIRMSVISQKISIACTFLFSLLGFFSAIGWHFACNLGKKCEQLKDS